MLVVSHFWESAEQQDPTGQQPRSIDKWATETTLAVVARQDHRHHDRDYHHHHHHHHHHNSQRHRDRHPHPNTTTSTQLQQPNHGRSCGITIFWMCGIRLYWTTSLVIITKSGNNFLDSGLQNRSPSQIHNWKRKQFPKHESLFNILVARWASMSESFQARIYCTPHTSIHRTSVDTMSHIV